MSEERCEGCGSTCVCCCMCEDELVCEPQTCPPFQTMMLSVTKLWFGGKHGWLTYDEAVARGLRDQLGAQPIVYRVNDDG